MDLSTISSTQFAQQSVSGRPPEFISHNLTVCERVTALFNAVLHAICGCCSAEHRSKAGDQWKLFIEGVRIEQVSYPASSLPPAEIDLVAGEVGASAPVIAATERASNGMIQFFRDDMRPHFDRIQAVAASPDLTGKGSKMAGLMAGQIVGDMIGVNTEFMDRGQAQEVVALGPLEVNTRYREEFVRIDSRAPEKESQPRLNWRRNFPIGGGTDDSDQAILLYRSVAHAVRGRESMAEGQKAFARGLIGWLGRGVADRDFGVRDGFTDRRPAGYGTSGTPRALGLGALVKSVIIDQRAICLEDPFRAAFTAWSAEKRFKPAANGALMRCTPMVGLFKGDQHNEMIAWTIAMAEVTHVDPRCIASCVAANMAIFNFIHYPRHSTSAILENAFTCGELAYREQMRKLEIAGANFAQAPEFQREFRDTDPLVELRAAIFLPGVERWEQLGLASGNIGYTYKCLSAVFFALKEAERMKEEGVAPQEIYRTVMTGLVGEGGDADTNGAPAGALLGAYLGYEAIPVSWRGLRDQHILAEMVEGAMEISALPQAAAQ